MARPVPRLRAGLLALALLILAPGVGMAQPAQPTEPTEPAVSLGEPFYDQARALYGDRDYAGALTLLVQAIQADPLDPRFWIGAARAANYAEQYDSAVQLYDVYIANFPAHAEAARRRADRLEAIRREREQANGHRATPATPVTLPPEQQAARATFLERLETGPIVSADRSGALTLYQTLLRTGFVSYELVELRQRLADAILAQLETFFTPTAATPVPVLELRGWEAVPTWYDAVEALGRPVRNQLGVQARLATAEGQRQLLNGNLEVAVTQFDQALALDPALVTAHLGLLMARHNAIQRDGCCLDPAGLEAHLQAVAAGLPPGAPYRDGLLSLLRGMLAADTGDNGLAADYLMAVFTTRPAPPAPASWRTAPPAPAPEPTPALTPATTTTP